MPEDIYVTTTFIKSWTKKR